MTRRGDDGGYRRVNWLPLSVTGSWSTSTSGRLTFKTLFAFDAASLASAHCSIVSNHRYNVQDQPSRDRLPSVAGATCTPRVNPVFDIQHSPSLPRLTFLTTSHHDPLRTSDSQRHNSQRRAPLSHNRNVEHRHRS